MSRSPVGLHLQTVSFVVFTNFLSSRISVEKLQDVEALTGKLFSVCLCVCKHVFICCLELTNNLWQYVLPGLQERVKDPTCSDRMAELLGNLSAFSLEW